MWLLMRCQLRICSSLWLLPSSLHWLLWHLHPKLALFGLLGWVSPPDPDLSVMLLSAILTWERHQGGHRHGLSDRTVNPSGSIGQLELWQLGRMALDVPTYLLLGSFSGGRSVVWWGPVCAR